MQPWLLEHQRLTQKAQETQDQYLPPECVATTTQITQYLQVQVFLFEKESETRYYKAWSNH